MVEIELACGWLPDDRCDQPPIGMAAHSTDGVIPICARCSTNFNIPLIQPRKA